MPVEISNGIGAVGDAHSNTNASWIDLLYDSFRVNVSSVDGTDFGAGRFITLHTGHRDEAHLRVGITSFDLMNEIHPEFCPSQFGLFLSCKGDIILLTASHHTSLTACAFIQINHHSPAVITFCVHSFHIGEVGRWGDREDPIQSSQ